MAKYGKTKNNTAHEEWSKGKKIGRSKQVWIVDGVPYLNPDTLTITADGHWEKLTS